MIYSAKQILFDHFLIDWEEKFNKIHFILNYISSYPELGSELIDVQFLKSDDLENSQLEWISLISELDNPIDSDFFKPYWVPIAKNSYDYFIDLSSDTFSLFESCYFFMEPYQWYKKIIFNDITKFLTSVDNKSISINEIIKTNELKKWELVEGIFNEREKLGFSGKIDLKPIDNERLFCKKGEYSYKLNEDTLEISGINSIVICLLPHEEEIILNHFDATYNKDEYVTTKIENIKALAFLLENVGFLSVHYYQFIIKSDPDSFVEFDNNKLIIKIKDRQIIENIINIIEILRI